MKSEKLTFQPCSEKQRKVLLEEEADILLTGGGAGSGKSMTCLMKALKYINDPAARVLIIRRSFPMLKLPGGLIDESKQIYTHFGGEYKIQPCIWVFPNGATIQFAPIPDDIQDWQGLQATNILIDEAAEFTEQEILFLLGRLRGAKYRGHLNITMTCNPRRESFLFDWVQFSLDPDTGIPRPGTEDIVRHFVNIGGRVYFSESADELWDEVGEKFSLNRDPKAGEVTFQPKKFKFIPMTIYDNTVILKRNPGYLANLLAQSRVNQLRYLLGSWTAKAEGEGHFRREWVEVVDLPPTDVTARVRSWDLAATEPSETYRNPDWTAGVLMSRDRFGVYYVEHLERFRKTSDKVLKRILQVAYSDGEKTLVTIPKDPGAGGSMANQYFIRTLAENGVYARSITITGNSGKMQRFLPLSALAESGALKVVKGDWNEDFFAELEGFDGSRKNKDD